MNTETKPKHTGRNIGRLREMKGIRQEALADAIGVNSQALSDIENSENVDDDKLKPIARELDMSPQAVRHFSEEKVTNYFNNFYDTSHGAFGNYNQNHCTFNPLDKLMEAYEENKKLYERLLEKK